MFSKAQCFEMKGFGVLKGDWKECKEQDMLYKTLGGVHLCGQPVEPNPILSA